MQHFPVLKRYWQLVAAAAALVIGAILILGVFGSSRSSDDATVQMAPAEEALVEAPSDPPAAPATPPVTQPATIIVYVSGAVHAPDVYQLPAHARVKDVVMAAGGLASDADPDQINLAARLADGQHVYVPRPGETAPVEATGGSDGATIAAQGELININTAAVAELESLPGIGQSVAQRIVEYRTAHGPFASVDDLQNVKGIGPATFEEIAAYITVGP